MGWRTLAVLFLLVSLVPLVVRAEPPRRTADRFRVAADGNELIGSRVAAVQYGSLDRLVAEIRRPLPASASAIRVVRASPPEAVGYVLCVTQDGTLVVGQQTFDMTPARPEFRRGEIARAYRPVERPGPWTWIVEIPLSRETELALVVEATAGTWPVPSVTITLDHEP